MNEVVVGFLFQFRLDYILHLAAYFLITLLQVSAYGISRSFFLFMVGFAFIEEGHQYFIPGRSMNPLDFLVDVAGISLAYLVKFATKRYSGYK